MNSGLIQTGSKLSARPPHGRIRTGDQGARDLLRRQLASGIERIWPKERMDQTEAKAIDPRDGLEALQNKLLKLSPQNDAQRWLQSQALEVSGQIAGTRWLLFEQGGQSALPCRSW